MSHRLGSVFSCLCFSFHYPYTYPVSLSQVPDGDVFDPLSCHVYRGKKIFQVDMSPMESMEGVAAPHGDFKFLKEIIIFATFL